MGNYRGFECSGREGKSEANDGRRNNERNDEIRQSKRSKKRSVGVLR